MGRTVGNQWLTQIWIHSLKISESDDLLLENNQTEIHLEKKLKNDSSFNSIAETSFIDGTNESRQIIDNFNKDDEIRLTAEGIFSLENSSFYGTIINPRSKSKLSRKSNLSVQ